jgi:hypothetical protein
MSDLSPHAQTAIDELVVREGRSYDDAIKRLDEWAERAAAPYQEAAEYLRQWIRDHPHTHA